MPTAAELAPALSILAGVVWEVRCIGGGVPNRHRGLLWCLAGSVWAAYYATVAIRDMAAQQHALGVVALSIAVMAGSLSRKALNIAPDVEYVDMHEVDRREHGERQLPTKKHFAA